jgi:uncharacterized protein YllA (UPF0747 family)
LSNPFDPFDNAVTRALDDINRINDAVGEVTRVNRMVEDAMGAATKPIRNAVHEAMAKAEAARPIVDEATRIYKDQTAHLDRTMTDAVRQVERQMDAFREVERRLNAFRSVQRQIDAISSVTRNYGYRW